MAPSREENARLGNGELYSAAVTRVGIEATVRSPLGPPGFRLPTDHRCFAGRESKVGLLLCREASVGLGRHRGGDGPLREPELLE